MDIPGYITSKYLKQPSLRKKGSLLYRLWGNHNLLPHQQTLIIILQYHFPQGYPKLFTDDFFCLFLLPKIQSIFIHYGVKIDCLGNQLQYTATDSSSLCQGKKTRVGRKTLIQSLAKKKHWNIFCYLKFSSPHDIKYFYELK